MKVAKFATRTDGKERMYGLRNHLASHIYRNKSFVTRDACVRVSRGYGYVAPGVTSDPPSRPHSSTRDTPGDSRKVHMTVRKVHISVKQNSHSVRGHWCLPSASCPESECATSSAHEVPMIAPDYRETAQGEPPVRVQPSAPM